ncbi:MAG TPA: DUF2793 domain-containing protein [Bosea sp. (in: a-proteobacteria)]|jgi:hypothetical protein|uniref:DUF2793 domain-containing protein n=1 Tax=Bosea sp. (in: a-proteobacteria) TaxID=1871050 RepID=UPI002E1509BB|nr:DUF2793 domain-containing protein [Bosea sp. (in: a-proteobacteria)]
MSATTRLAMPRIAAAQAQKHVTHNDALEIIDALLHLAVESRTTTAPPAPPVTGARYLVPVGATGAWAGHAGTIAAAEGSAWLFHTPQPGWLAFLRDEAAFVVFDGGDWLPLLRGASRFGVNAEPDATNRLAVSSPAVLLNHDGDDMRLVLNKAAVGNVGTLQFQTGFVTAAEIGLAGDNDLRVKVRDGAGLRQALVVKSGNGRVGVGVAEPAAEFEVADSSGDGDCRIQLRASPTEVAQLGVSATQVFLDTASEKPFIVYVNGAARAQFDGQGNLGIGVFSPTARLDVAGPIKVKSYTVATLPSPSSVGAGAMAYASNESAGPVMVFSDGASWRRVTDRAVAS